MGVKLEPIVKTFYENLEEGRITGRRCLECGAVEWPPVLVCNTCGCSDMEWMEISGKAQMTSVIMPSALSSKPENKKFMPFCLSAVELEEGPGVNALVTGVTKKNRAEILSKLPVPVHAKIVQQDGFKTVIFELDET